MKIILNTVGKVVNSSHKGLYVKVVPDLGLGATGGYYLLESFSGNFDCDGFDGWYESLEVIYEVFLENQWAIEWLDK